MVERSGRDRRYRGRDRGQRPQLPIRRWRGRFWESVEVVVTAFSVPVGDRAGPDGLGRESRAPAGPGTRRCREASPSAWPRGSAPATVRPLTRSPDRVSSSLGCGWRAAAGGPTAPILTLEVGRGARPAPVPGLLHQAGPGRILLDINHSCPEVFFVHHNREITGLPEVSGAAQPEVERTGVFAMYSLESACQGGALVRHGDEMVVVRHQPARRTGHAGGRGCDRARVRRCGRPRGRGTRGSR